MDQNSDNWNSGDSYEFFMGRWSRLMAPVFLRWLRLSRHQSWLDVGCGTGALSAAIAQHYQPSSLFCVDPSGAFLEKAKEQVLHKAEFLIGDGAALPLPDHSVDVVVSGLALNFFPDVAVGLQEMKRVVRPEGLVACYVWDYAGRMDFLRIFWDAACEADANAAGLDEGNRFPICSVDNLRSAFVHAGFSGVGTTTLDIDTAFSGFDDYWQPFLGGQGPAPGYLASLGVHQRENLRQTIYRKLPFRSDGSIQLVGRAIAVRGTNGR